MLQIYILIIFCLIINNNYKINIYIDTQSITDKVWKLTIPKIYSIDIKKMTRDYWLPSLEKSNLTFSLENHQKRKEKEKEKEKRASFPRKGIDWQKDTAHVRVFIYIYIYIYIYMITHRQPAIITKERESGRTHE